MRLPSTSLNSCLFALVSLYAVYALSIYLEKHRHVKPQDVVASLYLKYNDSKVHKDCRGWSDKTIRHVRKFVFFFGFNRCGSSATGNIIDAHPNAIVANEMVLWDRLAESDFSMLEATKKICKWAVYNLDNLDTIYGYSHKMGDFHGRFRQPLLVVGVRKSSKTTQVFSTNSAAFSRAVKKLVFFYLLHL